MREINLLPPSRRQRLRRQWMQEMILQLVRHVQITLLVTAVLGGITGGALKLTQILSTSRGEEAIPPLIQQYQVLRQEINEKNFLAEEVLLLAKNRIVWSDIVQSLLDVLPPGTTINHMQGSIITSNLEFTGRSVNRNSLIILQERLEQLPWAKTVTSPLQNLLARDNPDYSFTISLTTTNSPAPQEGQ